MYTIECKYYAANKHYIAWVAGDRDEYYGYTYGATAAEAVAAMKQQLPWGEED
jgi:hypothetical protein